MTSWRTIPEIIFGIAVTVWVGMAAVVMLALDLTRRRIGERKDRPR